MPAMHELGHVFGLLPGTSKQNPTDEELRQAHCLNECVMYWYLNSEFCEKIKAEPFCPSCLEKLKQFFIEPTALSPPATLK
jgi:predicted Zn-dependent protease